MWVAAHPCSQENRRVLHDRSPEETMRSAAFLLHFLLTLHSTWSPFTCWRYSVGRAAFRSLVSLHQLPPFPGGRGKAAALRAAGSGRGGQRRSPAGNRCIHRHPQERPLPSSGVVSIHEHSALFWRVAVLYRAWRFGCDWELLELFQLLRWWRVLTTKAIGGFLLFFYLPIKSPLWRWAFFFFLFSHRTFFFPLHF